MFIVDTYLNSKGYCLTKIKISEKQYVEDDKGFIRDMVQKMCFTLVLYIEICVCCFRCYFSSEIFLIELKNKFYSN